MIKVELLEQEESGRRILFFETNDPKQRDDLDKILEALVGPYPRRGAYVLGAPNETLKVEVNLKQ